MSNADHDLQQRCIIILFDKMTLTAAYATQGIFGGRRVGPHYGHAIHVKGMIVRKHF